ncbi:MAG: sugar phosphate isomerase/epimerase family protein [Dehalococcoidia bacterium]
MTTALSTMWAQQERFRGHMDEFARIAMAAGYTAIEPSHSTEPEGLEALLESAILPFHSIHAPAPKQRDGNGRWNGDLNLAALDEAERAAAVAHHRRTIDYASRAGAKAVVVHLGGCGSNLLDAERRLRSLYQSGERGGDQFERLREEAERARGALIVKYLPLAQRSLDELVNYAAKVGVAIGLENRLHYHEIPQVDEVAGLIAPYPLGAVGYWHDVGHAEVQDRLGLVDREEWLRTNGQRTIGAHLHDVAGILDHRAPGEGDVSWGYIAAGLPPEALRTFEINQHAPEALLSEGRRLLIEQGVVPEEVHAGI